MWKVKRILYFKFDASLLPEFVYALIIVHNEQTLIACLIFEVVPNVFRVCLKCNEFCTSQLEDFLLCGFIWFMIVERQLLNRLSGAWLLCVVYFFVVTTYEVTSNHGLWLAHYFELRFVEWRLHDAVIELYYQHTTSDTTDTICDQLYALDLVIVKAPLFFVRK